MIMNKGSLHMTITQRYNDHLTNKLKTLSQTFIPLVITSIFVVVAKIGVMTDGNDEPNYICLAGTLSYQEIQIQESNRKNTYNN